jgi:phenylalanyl-tRNA synthetase alpha chain
MRVYPIDMIAQIDEIKRDIETATIQDATSLEAFRIKFLGSKGVIKELYGFLKSVPNDQKKEAGKLINDLRVLAEDKFVLSKEQVDGQQASTREKIDFSRPGETVEIGARHPLAVVRAEIIAIFARIGYTISEGPEIEDDWHNFSALNFPPEHPARDMQDTFFVEKGEKEWALRTHTSSVQVRVMETQKPPNSDDITGTCVPQ